MSDTAGTERPVRGSRWSDDRSREALQSITEAICEVAGFDLVGVSAVRDDGYLQLLCVVGPEEAREALVDTLAPLEPLLEALENAEDWGRLKYVRHSRHRLDIDKWGWTSDGPRDVPDGVWHPEDILVAPLYGDDGRLIAVLGLDVPRDGLVPDESKRPLLDVYARQASGAVVATLERERMAERVRLAAAAADIVRRASASMSAERTLAECASAIVDGFRAQALWTQLVGEPPRAVHDAEPVMPPPDTVAAFERCARALWDVQDVAVFAPDRPPHPSIGESDHVAMMSFLATTQAGSLLLAPLGSAQECLGWIGMSRGRSGAEWSDAEAAMALDIGRDLGRALASARMFEREHQLVQELQELADYKSHLVATVSHELRTPLTSIIGYLELLSGDPGLSELSRTAIAAIERGSVRLSRVVEELLVLHRTADIARLDNAEPIDLAPLVTDIVELNTGPAESRGITLSASVTDDVAPVTGVAHELEHVVANLVGNAVKYTRDHGHVAVRLENADGEVVLTCTDDGIGISETDQEHVFEEFYRSTDPDAAQQSGTGLGLAIVRRVVERHRGRIELESELGAGSTFRVRLPAGVSASGS
jgi:signal transduction histidine kinase